MKRIHKHGNELHFIVRLDAHIYEVGVRDEETKCDIEVEWDSIVITVGMVASLLEQWRTGELSPRR